MASENGVLFAEPPLGAVGVAPAASSAATWPALRWRTACVRSVSCISPPKGRGLSRSSGLKVGGMDSRNLVTSDSSRMRSKMAPRDDMLAALEPPLPFFAPRAGLGADDFLP